MGWLLRGAGQPHAQEEDAQRCSHGAVHTRGRAHTHAHTLLHQGWGGGTAPAYLPVSLLTAGDYFATDYTEGNWKNQSAGENNPACARYGDPGAGSTPWGWWLGFPGSASTPRGKCEPWLLALRVWGTTLKIHLGGSASAVPHPSGCRQSHPGPWVWLLFSCPAKGLFPLPLQEG